jgi:hypothetical protein
MDKSTGFIPSATHDPNQVVHREKELLRVLSSFVMDQMKLAFL